MPGKLIAFDEDTLSKLNELGRSRMATFQELADEAFADLLQKHNVPIDLKDALRKSVKAASSGGPRQGSVPNHSKSHQRRAKRPRGG